MSVDPNISLSLSLFSLSLASLLPPLLSLLSSARALSESLTYSLFFFFSNYYYTLLQIIGEKDHLYRAIPLVKYGAVVMFFSFPAVVIFFLVLGCEGAGERACTQDSI